jgi:hypothetical protein
MKQNLVGSIIAVAIPFNAAYAQATPPSTPVKPSPATVSPTNAPPPPKVTQTKPSLPGAQGVPRVTGSGSGLYGEAAVDTLSASGMVNSPNALGSGGDTVDYRRRLEGPPKITPASPSAAQAAQQKK